MLGMRGDQLTPNPTEKFRTMIQDSIVNYKLLHEPFLVSAKKFKSKTAIINNGKIISYEQLDFYSSLIATEILLKSTNESKTVAVCLEKSWEQIVTVIAILKSGMTYLPISLSNPSNRIARILEIANTDIVITDSKFKVDFEPKIKLLDLGSFEFSEEIKAVSINADNHQDLAYIIFTSGTTDEPKGVMIEHESALNTIQDINSRFSVGPDDTLLSLSELNFDLSVYDIFGGLAAGATIVIPRNCSKRMPPHWYNLVLQHKVTIWNSVPAFMSIFMECIEKKDDPISLRLIMMSGDWISLNLPDKIKKKLPSCRIISLGGATEASIWSIIYEIEEVDPSWNSIPYGKALSNQEMYVLNENLEECCTDEPGEICIAGVGLAKGYLNNKKLTERAFIVHPVTGKRLYKTGDLGKYMLNGNIEILGRIDFQVKVKGYRIELKEIEFVLKQLPSISDVIVNAWSKDSLSPKTLICYTKLKPKGELEPKDLKAYLKSKLPSYMIPKFFYFIDEFPLSLNGKVDRSKLEVPPALTDG